MRINVYNIISSRQSSFIDITVGVAGKLATHAPLLIRYNRAHKYNCQREPNHTVSSVLSVPWESKLLYYSELNKTYFIQDSGYTKQEIKCFISHADSIYIHTHTYIYILTLRLPLLLILV